MAAACMNGFDTGFVSLGYAKVAVLGVVQGITELMPISSTAHMRLVPALLGWRDPGSAFSAAMQLAALAAVVSYFWSDVRGLVFGSLSATVRRDWRDRNFQFALAIVLGTIPIVVFGLLLSSALNACNTPLRSLWVIGWASLGMSLLLAVAELAARHKRKMEDWDFLDAIIVGICQVGALIPGVSRSGSTLTAALFLGFKRAEAARFSFLLGLPAITLAGGEGTLGAAPRRPRRARLERARRGPRCRQHFSLRGDMGPAAHSGALFGVAVRGLPRAHGRGSGGRRLPGLVELRRSKLSARLRLHPPRRRAPNKPDALAPARPCR